MWTMIASLEPLVQALAPAFTPARRVFDEVDDALGEKLPIAPETVEAL